MSKERLIDANQFFMRMVKRFHCNPEIGRVAEQGYGDTDNLRHILYEEPTIDPEELPIVQELRAQLCKEERESQHWKECYSRVCNDNWVAKKKLARYEQGGWISIKEDLPRVLQNVLVFRELGFGVKLYDICMFFDGRFFNKGRLIKNVTHWMPLPEQPKEE